MNNKGIELRQRVNQMRGTSFDGKNFFFRIRQFSFRVKTGFFSP